MPSVPASPGEEKRERYEDIIVRIFDPRALRRIWSAAGPLRVRTSNSSLSLTLPKTPVRRPKDLPLALPNSLISFPRFEAIVLPVDVPS